MASEPKIVRVNIPGAEYNVVIQPGLLAEMGQQLRQVSEAKKAALITDTHVGLLYAEKAEESLQKAGFEVIPATVPTGEQNKTIQTIASIYDQVLPFEVDRSTPLVALGGGVVGDMTGFAAATILRGVPFVQVPTTLLSMVDASVGGKTGIDHALGTNLIGAFHQPKGVFIDPAVLKTLPPRDLRSGLAECIKHDIIRDAEGFAELEKNIKRAIDLDVEYLAELVAHNVGIKAKVVESDPFEKGERAHLNFGHTFGHAIESVSGFSYAHGEGVALGMVAAARAAVALGMLDEPGMQRIVKLIQSTGLPTGGLKLNVDRVVASMNYDKKVKSGKIRFVLPTQIGSVVIKDDVPTEVVKKAVESLKN
ncbi:MAG TPA: 3-dehydroquinate synthase [Tepidisphaeraceae bacterium]|nr:3-dehydroquinate synthase [Tepidisphaeraceae bacterium]